MTKQLNKKGTSLVELIAVIVIMGIIAGIAIPTTIAVINRQKKNSAIKSCENILATAKTVLMEASSQGETGSLIGANKVVYTAATSTTNATYEVTSTALVNLGELEKDPTNGTLSIKLTVASGDTGANSFTCNASGITCNGYNLTWDSCNGFEIC